MKKRPARVHQILDVKQGEISSWRIFRIMAEFVEGFETISKYEKAVTFFGSARLKSRNPHYKEAQQLAQLLSKDNYTVITGGGPGIMEAANRGAFETKGGGKSVGLNIELPMEQILNTYVHDSQSFHHFFTRKVMLALASEIYIYCPGGFGTLDELFELLTLIQTKKIPATPVVLLNKDFWQPLLDWCKKTLVQEYKTISPEDMDLFYLADDANDAYQWIKKLPRELSATSYKQIIP